MLVPVGFPEGEAQFEGAGVLVTGYAIPVKPKLASSLAAPSGVGAAKWACGMGRNGCYLPTTVTTTGDDGAATTACATITGNGTYAFIKYVTEPDKLPACWNLHG